MYVWWRNGASISRLPSCKKDRYRREIIFEFLEWIEQQPSLHNLRIVIVYRSPYSDEHKVPTSTFFSEFADNLASIVLCREQLLLSGDFNIHVDYALNADCEKLTDLLESYGLQQHVTGPTHKHDHTLDLNQNYYPLLETTLLFNTFK